MKKKYSNKQKTEERLFVTRGTRISDTKKRTLKRNWLLAKGETSSIKLRNKAIFFLKTSFTISQRGSSYAYSGGTGTRNGGGGGGRSSAAVAAAAAAMEDDDEYERGHWGSKAEFILSCVGFSVSFPALNFILFLFFYAQSKTRAPWKLFRHFRKV